MIYQVISEPGLLSVGHAVYIAQQCNIGFLL